MIGLRVQCTIWDLGWVQCAIWDLGFDRFKGSVHSLGFRVL